MPGTQTRLFGLAGLLAAASTCLAAAPVSHGVRYRVQTTTRVTLSLPAPSQAGAHLYRNASGRWAPLPDLKHARDALTFTLAPQQLRAGSTIVLLAKPDWLEADDATPPRVVQLLIDGKPAAIGERVELGWLDSPPKTIELRVADDLNPIDPTSVMAEVNGVRVVPDGQALRFVPDPGDNKKGRVICSVPTLRSQTGHGTTRIAMRCDDFAPDEAACEVAVLFTVTQPPQITLGKPNAVAANGIKVFCDSIHRGYENVECMVDGKLQVPGETTYGCTWASAETETDHWVCFVFPQPKPLAGLDISWAHYRSRFWTAARYDIMTWDGKGWQRAQRVQRNPEAQTTSHRFTPRSTDRVLVWVPAGGNHPERPNLTWITEAAFPAP